MTEASKPELVLDPETNRYSIVVDNVEVIGGLDPIGLRAAKTSVAESREKIIEVLPFLRRAMADAKKEGDAQIGILAAGPNGGRIVARFNAAEFIDDLCKALGTSVDNTDDEQADSSAVKIIQMVENAGGRIVSTPIKS